MSSGLTAQDLDSVGAILTLHLPGGGLAADQGEGSGSSAHPYITDAVWSVGIAAAGLSSTATEGAEGAALGHVVQQRLLDGTVHFDGGSGALQWGEDGKRDTASVNIEFSVLMRQGDRLIATTAARYSGQPGSDFEVLDDALLHVAPPLGWAFPGTASNESPDWGEWVVMLVGAIIGAALMLGVIAATVLGCRKMAERRDLPKIVPMLPPLPRPRVRRSFPSPPLQRA